jgi:hypothetical protein
VLRYLAAFGPASTMDIQTWSGVTRLRPVVEGLADELRRFRDERGRTLVDLPDAPRPDPDVPAPVRFLPEYDNLLLSHDDRTRVVAEEHRRRVAVRNAVVPGSVLVDGFARAAWKVTRGKGTAVLAIEPFERLAASDRVAVEQEAARLLAFLAPEDDHDVRFATIL